MTVDTVPQRRKSLTVAYVLWLVFGIVGAHRFYLGRPKTALIFVACTIGGIAFSVSSHPEWSRLMFVSLAMMLFDLFGMPTLAGRGKAKPAEAKRAEPVVLLRAQGKTGSVEAMETGIVIDRRGFVGVLIQGFKGRKSIPYRSITAVQFKPANAFVNGFIQFSLPGGIERQGLFDSGVDENTVTFVPKQQAAFERMREFIEDRIARGVTPDGGRHSTADEIEKLVGLRDRGLLTDDEFTAQKSRLLQ